MNLQAMYPAITNSPATVTTGALAIGATEVAVGDSGVFGIELPQLATLGDSSNAETVLITAVSGNVLTITRAVEGTAKAWMAGTVMARNFCAVDHNALIANIKNLDERASSLDVNKLPIKKAFTTSSGTDYNKWFKVIHFTFPDGFRQYTLSLNVFSSVTSGKIGKLAVYVLCDNGSLTISTNASIRWESILGFSPDDFVIVDHGDRSCGIYCRVPATYMAYNFIMLSEDGNATVNFIQYAASLDVLPTGTVYTSTIANATIGEYGPTKLYDGTDSDSLVMAATAHAVKMANDIASTKAPVDHKHQASDINSGSLDVARLPSHKHQALDINSGTIDIARLSVATQVQAETGTDTSTVMTPQRVKQAIIASKPTVITDLTTTSKSQLLADNNEYRFGTLTSLTLTFPSGDFDSHVAFTSGSTATAFIASGAKCLGTDTTSGVFTPVANKRYNLSVWYDGVNKTIAVGGGS